MGVLALDALWVAGRVMLALAVALLVAGIVADVAGAKVESTYSSEVPVKGSFSAAAIMVSTPTSAQRVTVNVTGAKAVYYIKVQGDPINLLLQAVRVGVRLSNQEVHHDFRAGVIVGHATIEANPLVLMGVIAQASSANMAKTAEGGLVVESLEEREGLIVVAIPDDNVTRLPYKVDCRIVGYSRMSNDTLSAVSIALAAVGFSFILAYRRANA